MSSIGIKTGDTIEVVTGKDRGKRGKARELLRELGMPFREA